MPTSGLGGPLGILQFLLGVLGSFETQNIQRELREKVLPAQEELGGRLTREARTAGEQITGEARGLRTRAMDLIQNLGAQERRDVQSAFAGAQSRGTQDLISRGLTAGSAASSVAGTVGRARSDALGALEERLRGQQISTDILTTGELMRAQSETVARNIAVEQGMRDRLTELMFGTAPRSVALDASTLLGASRIAPQPEQPDFWDQLAGGFAGGAGSAAGTVGGLGVGLGALSLFGAPSGGIPGLPNFKPPSARILKENIDQAPPVLRHIQTMPVSVWHYKGDAVQHIGPMAEDFHDAFGVGADDGTISMVDAFGITIKGIQELTAIVDDLREEVRSLRERTEHTD